MLFDLFVTAHAVDSTAPSVDLYRISRRDAFA
jgi:hypothetical protein